MHTLRNDLRYAARSLRKSPLFTAVVVLTLAPGICWMIVRQVLLVAMIGVACGFMAAATFTSSLSALLFGVTRFDLHTSFSAALALVLAAVAAGAPPIARAARVDPMMALRSE